MTLTLSTLVRHHRRRSLSSLNVDQRFIFGADQDLPRPPLHPPDSLQADIPSCLYKLEANRLSRGPKPPSILRRSSLLRFRTVLRPEREKRRHLGLSIECESAQKVRDANPRLKIPFFHPLRPKSPPRHKCVLAKEGKESTTSCRVQPRATGRGGFDLS